MSNRFISQTSKPSLSPKQRGALGNASPKHTRSAMGLHAEKRPVKTTDEEIVHQVSALIGNMDVAQQALLMN